MSTPYDDDAPAGPGRPVAPGSSRVVRGLWHSAVVAGAWVLAVLSVGSARYRHEAVEAEGWLHTLGGVWIGLGLTAAFLGPLLLLLRWRYPRIAWDLGLMQLLLPIGPIMAFALPTLIRRATGRTIAMAVGFHAVGMAVFFALDSRGTRGQDSVVRLFSGVPEGDITRPVDLNITSVVTLYLVVVLVPVIIGFVGRYREQLAESRRRLAASREDLEERGASMGRMEEALSRKEEREMMAREIHDVIGHRLSMINVYAGGLELAAEGDPHLEDRARLIREASQQTVDDLRSLVQVMRDPASGARGTHLPQSLEDVVGMIERVVGAGRPLASSVMIDRPGDAPPVLVHAVYRILQELLTNTQKHASTAPVRVRVAGGPGRGIEVEVGNPVLGVPPDPSTSAQGGTEDQRWVPPSGQGDDAGRAHAVGQGDYARRTAAVGEGDDAGGAPPSGGTGLAGIRERAAALGGTVQVVPGPREFVVRVHLPWSGADGGGGER
ncbi:MAG: histidine kinase [bacterium]|nr:histidine kinase [bacterium]